MPNIVHGNSDGRIDSTLLGTDLDYKYPYELDIKPDSKVHKKIVSEVLSRARESHNLVNKRVDSWNEIERVMTAYIDLSEDEKDIKNADSRKPVSIVFPYSYVIMETLLTYLVMAFLQDPIIKYMGVSPEDQIGAMMLEKVVQNQCNAFKVGLSLHTFLRDSLVYGIGTGAPTWKTKSGIRIREDEGGFMSFFRGHGNKTYEEEILYEGNALNNVDPYLSLPDPRTPSQRIQDSEYTGWIDRTSYIALLREEKLAKDVFNVKYLKGVNLKRSSIFSENESDRNKKTGISSYQSYDVRISSPVDVIYLYIDLIPKDWELGTSEYPEKWLFGVANDCVVIKAKKLGLAHGMYPLISASPDFDGYSILPLARTEILYGMQNVLDFLFNSHIANTRKAVNDVLIVDPYLVNIDDLKDPDPGKLVRLRRPAWGKGVKDAVQQLEVNDITRANIADTSFIINWMQKIGGADESMMGALRQGGPDRLTGQEFQGTRAGAVSRMERIAKVISLQAFQDMGYMFASHTQQLMSKDSYVKIAGRWQQELAEVYGGETSHLKVTPWDILVDYDVEIKDGSVPGNGDVKGMSRLYETLAKNPGLAQKFDMGRILEWLATEMGVRNVGDFRIKTKVVPDEVAMRARERGNIVPTGGNV